MDKKFLLLASYPDSLVIFRRALICALVAEGLKVHVAAPDLPASSPIRKELEVLGVRVHEIVLQRAGMNPIVDVKTVYSLWRLLRQVQPDFFLGYSIKPVIYGNISAWLAGVPNRYSLITGLGYTFQGACGQRKWIKKIVQSLYRVALGKTHKVFFQNPDDEALFDSLSIVGSPSQKTVVVNGSGIDTNEYTVQPFPESTRFLLIARLLGDKGVREYFKAATRVRRQNPDVRFGLVGWIDENPDAITQSELEEWIASGDLQFYGRLDDVKPAITDCTVYVLPSYREGIPRTVLEAMAMGRPIITTHAPGCRETVVDGVNGFLIPVKAVDELVISMMKFIERPETASRMGKHSRRIAEEKYDIQKVNEHMLIEMGIK